MVRRTAQDPPFKLDTAAKLPRVDILYIYEDMPGDLVDAAVKAGAKGIVAVSRSRDRQVTRGIVPWD